MPAPSSYFPIRPDGTPTPHLAVRRTEFVVRNTDGTYRMVDAAHAGPRDKIRTTPDEIVTLTTGGLVRAQYFVGTSFHETGHIVNTWETEPNGFVSVGTYQQGAEEAYNGGGYSLIDMLDIEKSSKAIKVSAEAHREQILTWAGGPSVVDKPEISALLGAMWNHGSGFMHGFVAQHRNVHDIAELWTIYQRERPNDNIVTHKYGVDCITGGPTWPKHLNLPPEGQNTFAAIRKQIEELFAKFGVKL